MTGKLGLVIACALLLACLAGVSPTAGQTQFKVTVTGIMVPVHVRDGGRPVPSLQADDFQVLDDGVPQTVRAVSASTIALDVSLVIENTESAEYTRARYVGDVDEIRALLREGDRLRIVAAGSNVTEVLPLSSTSSAAEAPVMPAATTWMALYDAIGSVLVRSTVPGRQHVVLVLTKGNDTLSVISSHVLAELARWSSAQVHTLMTSPPGTGTRRVAKRPVPAPAWRDWEPERQVALRARGDRTVMTEREARDARDRDMRERLVRVATLTGGSQLRGNFLTGSFAGAVRRVLEEVRASYILYYTPTGVPETGWHPITVTMKDPAKKYEIRVRPGFMR